MRGTSKLYHADSSACQKDKLRCAFKHFFAQSSSKRVFHDTSGGTFRVIMLTRDPSLLVLKIHGKSDFLKMLTHVDNGMVIYNQFSFKRLIPPVLIDHTSPE